MSKPLTTTTPALFAERIQRVQAEVIARTASTPANERNGHRARLWCAWIRKNILDVPTGSTASTPMNKIDGDFFAGRIQS